MIPRETHTPPEMADIVAYLGGMIESADPNDPRVARWRLLRAECVARGVRVYGRPFEALALEVEASGRTEAARVEVPEPRPLTGATATLPPLPDDWDSQETNPCPAT